METCGEHERFIGYDCMKVVDEPVNIRLSSCGDANNLNTRPFQCSGLLQGFYLVVSLPICDDDDHFGYTISILPWTSEYLPEIIE